MVYDSIKMSFYFIESLALQSQNNFLTRFSHYQWQWYISFNIWWYIIRSASSYKKRDYNLTVQRNLSEKEDELLQCSRWLQQSQANTALPTRKGKKNPISLSFHRGHWWYCGLVGGRRGRNTTHITFRSFCQDLWYISRIQSVIVRSRSEWQMIIYCG